MEALSDTTAQALLTFIQVHARARWAMDGGTCPYDEYLDQGHTALLRSLEQYRPQPGGSLRAYARARIQYALRDTSQDYWRWKMRREPRETAPTPDTILQQVDVERLCQRLPAALQDLPAHIRAGGTLSEYATAHDMTLVALSLRLRKWRKTWDHS
jgi:DNA-directed RNA polymerase specialized sigma subunit